MEENKDSRIQLRQLPPQGLEIRLAEKVNNSYVKHYLIPAGFLIGTNQNNREAIQKIMAAHLKSEVVITWANEVEYKNIPNISKYTTPFARHLIRNIPTEKKALVTEFVTIPVLIKGDSLGQNMSRLLNRVLMMAAGVYMSMVSKYQAVVSFFRNRVYQLKNILGIVPEVKEVELDDEGYEVFFKPPPYGEETLHEKIVNFYFAQEPRRAILKGKLVDFAISFESSDLEEAMNRLNYFIENNSGSIISKLSEPQLILKSDTVGDGLARYILHFPFHVNPALVTDSSGFGSIPKTRFFEHIVPEGTLPLHIGNEKVGIEEIHIGNTDLALEFIRLKGYGSDFTGKE